MIHDSYDEIVRGIVQLGPPAMPTIWDRDVIAEKEISLEVEPGDVVFFNLPLVHGEDGSEVGILQLTRSVDRKMSVKRLIAAVDDRGGLNLILGLE